MWGGQVGVGGHSRGPRGRLWGGGVTGTGLGTTLILFLSSLTAGRSEALALDGAKKSKAEPPKGQEERGQEEEEPAGAPPGPTRGRPSREPELEELGEEFSKEWEDAKRWSKMEQLAQELTAEKRLEGKDEDAADPDPDRSMKLSFRSRAYGFRDSGPHLRRGWRPSSREDSVEAGLPARGHSYPEEKKEEEGSANRRAEVGNGRSSSFGPGLAQGLRAGTSSRSLPFLERHRSNHL